MNRIEKAALTVKAVNNAANGRRSTSQVMPPVVLDHTPVSIGAVVSVPDTKEHEDLARRVAELEALFGRFNTGYKSFEGTCRAQVAQMTEFNTRLAAVEQKCERMSSDIKLLTDKLAGMGQPYGQHLVEPRARVEPRRIEWG